jgi:hypothetical protein
MVRFASFIATALLAGSMISAAPLVKSNGKLLTGGHPDKAASVDPANLSNTTTVGDPTNPDNTTSVDPANPGNTTVVDPNNLGNNTGGTNTTAPLCDSGLANKAKKKHHKGGAKGKGANEKAAAKKHGNKDNANATASGLPPCNVTSGGNPENINNATNPEAALAKSSKKKGKLENDGTAKIANIARSLLGLPRRSHLPKRRLTPVTLWEDEE